MKIEKEDRLSQQPLKNGTQTYVLTFEQAFLLDHNSCRLALHVKDQSCGIDELVRGRVILLSIPYIGVLVHVTECAALSLPTNWLRLRFTPSI
jgi:hypothetical protein